MCFAENAIFGLTWLLNLTQHPQASAKRTGFFFFPAAVFGQYRLYLIALKM